MTSARDSMNAAMTEAELLDAVRQTARLSGFLTYHTSRSEGSEPGFPDLVMANERTGALLFRELKTMNGRTSQAQRQWIAALRSAGADADVLRPDGLAAFQAHLAVLGAPLGNDEPPSAPKAGHPRPRRRRR